MGSIRASYLFLFAFLLPALSGCGSVKENRLECPMFVFFGPDVNTYGCGTSATVRIIRGGDVSLAGVFPMEEFTDRFFCVSTQRGSNSCSVVCGGTVMGSNVICRTGEPAGEVYALCESFTAGPEDEEYTVRDTLCRQTAPVTLTLQGDSSDGYPLDLRIRSSWAGFDLVTLEPVRGDYSLGLECVPESKGHATLFCVPRQGDDSLVLEFLKDGTVIYGYPLGEAIVRSGYDWTEKNLAPVALEINYSLTGIAITVNDWSEQILIECLI